MTISEKRVKDLTHLANYYEPESDRSPHSWNTKGNEAQGPKPVIQNGAASALLALDRPKEVPPLMSVVVEYYPTFLNTYLNLGKAYLVMKKWEPAMKAYEQVLGINPFHPEVHSGLLQIYTELGMKEKAEQARSAMEIIKQ